MAYTPYSPQIGAKYVIVGPNNVRAAFNDPTDPDHVGVLSEVTGLDSSEVREAGEDLASADGGQHGDFWYGRRAITMTGTVFGHASMQERDIRLDRLRRATNALRGDATLYWQNLPLGSNAAMQLPVRRQARLQIAGAWVKEFQIALVSEYSQLFGQTLKVSGAIGAAAVSLENQGDTPSFPLIKMSSNMTADAVIRNDTTGQELRFTPGGTVGGEVNVSDHTLRGLDGNYYNGRIDFPRTSWPTLVSGANTFRLADPVTGTFTVTYRDTWS